MRVAIIVFCLLGWGCENAKMRLVSPPSSTTAPAPVCPPIPTLRLVKCYKGSKLVLEVWAANVANVRCSSDIKCVVSN